MPDALLIGTRFALYADLLLLVGIAAFPLHSRSAWAAPVTAALTPLATLGLALATGHLLLLGAAMFGVSPSAIDGAMIGVLIGETDMGTTGTIRIGALALALGAALTMRGRLKPMAVAVATAGALALATLAWSGHAAATEGAWGTLHRASDALHLIAAAVWLGAIAALLMHIGRPTGAAGPPLADTAQTLERFAPVGTACVGVILFTGIVNGVAIAGIDGIGALPETAYGRLLALKILLFGLMLALAAANRWRLTPRLRAVSEAAATSAAVEPGRALRAIRVSLLLEMAAAAAILGLVAWLGTLAPLPDASA
ncbi:MAG: copper homeostasis membrane protein CopD [Sphingopyxis sp.]|uniref:copper homeostasis membrane protein CopD n=1 Tax=Sphingopyxis sp. TaxID=1908224 RepID=UPI002AB96FFE|nr:copper homeostasis membrane protein CopD [Sphingopyxis sp.]MDZ3831720.1 copper homeostasis membrane protein CopD [Sphingopyxis sp.]